MAKAKAVLGQGKAQTSKELKDYGNFIYAIMQKLHFALV